MTHSHAYEDLQTVAQMSADARKVPQQLTRLGVNADLQRAAQAAVRPAPSIHFADYPREVSKREITVSAAAAKLANSLHLHLD